MREGIGDKNKGQSRWKWGCQETVVIHQKQGQKMVKRGTEGANMLLDLGTPWSIPSFASAPSG